MLHVILPYSADDWLHVYRRYILYSSCKGAYLRKQAHFRHNLELSTCKQ